MNQSIELDQDSDPAEQEVSSESADPSELLTTTEMVNSIKQSLARRSVITELPTVNKRLMQSSLLLIRIKAEV